MGEHVEQSDQHGEEQDKRASASGRNIGGLRIWLVSALMIVLACLVSLMLLQAVQKTSETYNALSQATDSYVACEQAANEMKEGSNYLTAQVRQFVITHDVKYLDNYFTEAAETQRRGKAVEVLDSYAGTTKAHSYLEESARASNELMDVEYYAAKLVLEASGDAPNKGADTLAEVQLSAADQKLSAEKKYDKAMAMVFGDEYQEHVNDIESAVALCKSSLMEDIESEQSANSAELNRLLVVQQAVTWLLLAVALVMIICIVALILWPLREYISRIGKNKSLPMVGARELRILANEYNSMYEANLKHNDDLRRRAEHDHLTGLYNREVFERLLTMYRDDDTALLLIDADYFKTVNDTYGHDVGDKILQKLAGALSHTFRSTDFPCRIGGDEFAVIMTEVTSDLAYVIDAKINAVKETMANDSDGLPSMTLSIGVAFNDPSEEFDTVYKHADEALYRVKEAGRNGYAFY